MFDLITFAAAAAPAGTEAAVKEFGIVEALTQGGPVAWGTAAIMAVMSAVSWYIMFTKVFEQGKILKQSQEGVAKFWAAGSIKDGQAKLEKNTVFRQLVDDGIKAEEEHGKLTDPMDQHEWMHDSLRRSQDAINSKLATGLSFLATVGSTSPFIGLFGTVIGIYRALIKIGLTGDASIDKVAGPVGEALIMTAIGLAVAVPAVMGYNWLQGRNKAIQERMSNFANDLHGYMMSGGSVRPATKAAAAPAAKAAPAKA